jgi:glucosamine--fructose-6-phosphate aminotransferase (isomerizing)
LPVTNRFVYLEEGDIARLTRDSIDIYAQGERIERPIKELDAAVSNASKGEYKHHMLKEIYEQPDAIQQTISRD